MTYACADWPEGPTGAATLGKAHVLQSEAMLCMVWKRDKCCKQDHDLRCVYLESWTRSFDENNEFRGHEGASVQVPIQENQILFSLQAHDDCRVR